MRAIPAALAVLLLCVAPVLAQPVTPTPRAPASGLSAEMQVLDHIASLLEAMSATDTSTVNAAVLLLGAAFFVLMVIALVVILWISRGGLTPLWQTITAERQRATAAEQSELRLQTIGDERERREDEYRAKTATAMQTSSEIQERTAHILEGLETTEQAAQGRKTAVETVTQHVTNDGNLTRNDVKGLKAQLDRLLELLSKDDKRGDPDMAEARGRVIEITESVVKMTDTGELPPLDSITKEDPGKSDIWSGDTPDLSGRPEGQNE